MTTRSCSAVSAIWPMRGPALGLVPVAAMRTHRVSRVKAALIPELRSPTITTGRVPGPGIVVAGRLRASAAGRCVLAESLAIYRLKPIDPAPALVIRFAAPFVIRTESTIDFPNPGGRMIRCTVYESTDDAGGTA